MTAYVTAALQNLLLRSLALPITPSAAQTPRPLHGSDAAETLPILFRSEGFAEDLFDSHPTH